MKFTIERVAQDSRDKVQMLHKPPYEYAGFVRVRAEARNLRLNIHATQERLDDFYLVRQNRLCPLQECNDSHLDSL